MPDKTIKILFILVVLLPVCFGNWGLTESSEARYAEISREMYLSKDYINPTLLGINHFHKPPITYYITAASYHLFGVNEIAARVFLAIGLLLQLLLCFKITKLLYKHRRLAFIATLIYFSYPLVQAAAKNLTTDCFLTTFIFAAIYFYLLYRNRKDRSNIYLYLFYIFCGLSFLTKGPVGVLPSGVFAITYNLVSTEAKKATIHHFLGLFICLLLCCSWFVFLLYDNPALFNYFIQHQLVDRVSNDSFSRTQPLYYYLYVMPLTGLPGIILLFHYLSDLIRKKQTPKNYDRVIAITFIVCFLVFCISASKLALYILPLYLFIAILSAKHLNKMDEKKLIVFSGIFFYFYLALLLVVFILAIVPSNFNVPFLPVSLIAIVGIIALIIMKLRMNQLIPTSVILIPVTGIAVLTFVGPVIMKANELEINSIKPVAWFINSSIVPHPETIFVYDQLIPSLQFYCNKKVVTIYNNNRKARRETQFEMNELYKSNYIVVKDQFYTPSFQNLPQGDNFCLLLKKDNLLPDSLMFLVCRLYKKSVIGKWILYHK